MAVRKSPTRPRPARADAVPAKPVSRRPAREARPAAATASPVSPVPVAASPTPDRGKKRKRLAKAFSRPLDKVLRKPAEPVRERFTLLQGEYEQLVRIKKQLAAQEYAVKKSDLVRAGLFLLSAKTEDEIRAVLSALPALG